MFGKEHRKKRSVKDWSGILNVRTSCLPYPVLQPSIVCLTMLVLTFIHFVAHSFSGACVLLLSFYCHLPVIRLCACNTSKAIVVVFFFRNFISFQNIVRVNRTEKPISCTRVQFMYRMITIMLAYLLHCRSVWRHICNENVGPNGPPLKTISGYVPDPLYPLPKVQSCGRRTFFVSVGKKVNLEKWTVSIKRSKGILQRENTAIQPLDCLLRWCRVYTEVFWHIPLTFLKITPVFPDFRLKSFMFFPDPILQNILFSWLWEYKRTV